MNMQHPEKQDAYGQLRQLLPIGATVHMILRHRQQGKWMEVDSYHFSSDPEQPQRTRTDWLVPKIAKVLDLQVRAELLVLRGTGTDLCSDLIQDLSTVLYGRSDALEYYRLSVLRSKEERGEEDE